MRRFAVWILPVAAVAVGGSGPVFEPGAVWLDTAGEPIRAHAGGLLKVNATYFWYWAR